MEDEQTADVGGGGDRSWVSTGDDGWILVSCLHQGVEVESEAAAAVAVSERITPLPKRAASTGGDEGRDPELEKEGVCKNRIGESGWEL